MDPKTIEEEVRVGLAAGDNVAAVNAALRGHGADVFGFLVGVLGRTRAVAAYRSAAEMARLEIDDDAAGWLPRWLYGVAWRAAARHAEEDSERSATLPDAQASTRRSSAGTFRRVVAELRAGLTLDERALLVLRVARGLPWLDIASIQLGTRADTRVRAWRARSLRAQFSLLRNALRREAVASGLLPAR